MLEVEQQGRDQPGKEGQWTLIRRTHDKSSSNGHCCRCNDVLNRVTGFHRWKEVWAVCMIYESGASMQRWRLLLYASLGKAVVLIHIALATVRLVYSRIYLFQLNGLTSSGASPRFD